MIRFVYPLCLLLTLTSSTRASEQQPSDPKRAAALLQARQGRPETLPIPIPGRSAEDASKARQEQAKSASWENVLKTLLAQGSVQKKFPRYSH